MHAVLGWTSAKFPHSKFEKKAKPSTVKTDILSGGIQPSMIILLVDPRIFGCAPTQKIWEPKKDEHYSEQLVIDLTLCITHCQSVIQIIRAVDQSVYPTYVVQKKHKTNRTNVEGRNVNVARRVFSRTGLILHACLSYR